jgi:hypothetical protein
MKRIGATIVLIGIFAASLFVFQNCGGKMSAADQSGTNQLNSNGTSPGSGSQGTGSSTGTAAPPPLRSTNVHIRAIPMTKEKQ